MPLSTPLTRDAGIEVPLICGAMYPCSNPELVAAVSEAGGIGVVQPISLTYVHGHEFRAGLRYIRSPTSRPIGMNALIEQSSRTYRERMGKWVDGALEEGVRFFITSLGNPRWVAERAHAAGGVVYHDVTERKWAQKAVDAGVQMGTRFIATAECRTTDAYKQAIVDSGEDDIVLSERITGVPVAVIRTPYIEKMGLRVGPVARWMFRGRKTKHWMRSFYALRSLWQLKRASLGEVSTEYWQAGKSVAGIDSVEAAGEIVRRFARAAVEDAMATRRA